MQQARLLELRSTMMLAQLWAERGERQKACDLLAPLYASFTEGFTENPDALECMLRGCAALVKEQSRERYAPHDGG